MSNLKYVGNVFVVLLLTLFWPNLSKADGGLFDKSNVAKFMFSVSSSTHSDDKSRLHKFSPTHLNDDIVVQELSVAYRTDGSPAGNIPTQTEYQVRKDGIYQTHRVDGAGKSTSDVLMVAPFSVPTDGTPVLIGAVSKTSFQYVKSVQVGSKTVGPCLRKSVSIPKYNIDNEEFYCESSGLVKERESDKVKYADISDESPASELTSCVHAKARRGTNALGAQALAQGCLSACKSRGAGSACDQTYYQAIQDSSWYPK